MEPPSPSVYSSSARSTLHNRVSMLLSRSPRVGADLETPHSIMRASQKLRLTIAPRPSFRALATRSISTRPPSSTRSIIDPAAPPVLTTASPATQPPPTPLTPQERIEVLYANPLTPIDHTWRRSRAGEEDLHTETRRNLGTRRRTTRRKSWNNLFRRSSFRRHRVRAKAILSAVFGFTLIATLAIYLGLAATGIGNGLMFHILFIIFILALTTVFVHSLLTMCLLILKPSSRHHQVPRIRPSSLTAADLPPEKPIPIVMAIDEEAGISPLSTLSPTSPLEKNSVRPPPPIYGVWRDTKRMDPNLVHWAKLPPSPDTPTYEEAVRDIESAVGRRPPSYVYVNGVLVEEGQGTTAAHRDLRHDSTVHPLERERVQVLFGEAL